MYLEEVFFLMPQIKKRRLQEIKNQIILYHHAKPEDLLKELEDGTREMDDTYDREGLLRLKNILSSSSSAIKVK